jgi:hypothetical protein
MQYLAVVCTLLASLSMAPAQEGGATLPRTVQIEPSFPNDLVKIDRAWHLFPSRRRLVQPPQDCD